MTTNKKIIQARMWKLFNQGVPKDEIYSTIVEKYGIDRKKASAHYLDLMRQPARNQFQLKLLESDVDDIPPINYTKEQVKKILKQEGENLFVSVNLDFEVRTLEALLAACEVDGTKWEVLSWQCKKWDLGIKNAQEKIETKQLFSVSAKFKPKKLDNDLGLQKEVLLKELLGTQQVIVVQKEEYHRDTNNEYLLELALFDMHFGKLAHHEECGADYDLKIAAKRYKTAIKDLLSQVDINSINRILLPIGNDMINIDNIHGTTTAGTPQDSDSRFYKIVRTVKEVLIETINELATIAPVDVVVVVGNHDEQTSFLIGEMIDAYYHSTTRVSVFNNAAPRKYYQYGKTSFMFTHGNKEKHTNLGMIFAAENPKLWCATTQRYIQLGHYHSNKKINYLSNEEFQGFQIQIIPSLSGNDAWHSGKGYNSLKQAKAFLYHKEKGLRAEITHTVE